MKAPRWLFEPPRPLKGAEALILLVLIPARLQDRRLSAFMLAKKACIARNTCKRALISLDKMGVVNFGPGGWSISDHCWSISDREGGQELTGGVVKNGPATPPKTPTQSDIPFPLDLNLDLTPRSTSIAAPPRRPKAGKKVPGPEGEILRHFGQLHQEVLGVPYLANFKAEIAAIRRQLNGSRKVELLMDLTTAFWREQKLWREGDESRYVGRATPTVLGMIGQIPNLLNRYEFEVLNGATDGQNGSAGTEEKTHKA